VAKRVSHKKSAAQTRDEGVFAIDLARVTAAGFLATTLGTGVFKTESLDIRGILGTIATLMTPMDQPTA